MFAKIFSLKNILILITLSLATFIIYMKYFNNHTIVYKQNNLKEKKDKVETKICLEGYTLNKDKTECDKILNKK